MKTRHPPGYTTRGFSLLEVLVALLIVSLGLLGVSKMQVAAISNTQIARTRSLVAFQASSLAAAMRGNRAYWADATAAPGDVRVKGAVVSGMASSAECAKTPCAPDELAGYDVKTWANDMNTHFNRHEARIACSAASGKPVSCLVEVKWKENYVAINRNTADAAAAVPADDPSNYQYFTLFVEP